MLGLFPTLQSRIDHFSKSSTGIAVRRCFNKSFYFAKCHWPRLLIGFSSLKPKSIPTIIFHIQETSTMAYQLWLGGRPQTRHVWAMVKMMTFLFIFNVIDPLVHSWFVTVARPNPSNLPSETCSSTTPSLTAADLTQEKDSLTLSKVTSILNRNAPAPVPASITSPYIFRIGQGLFLKWCAHALGMIGFDIWFLVSGLSFLDAVRLILDLAGVDLANISLEESMNAWLWLEEGWAWVEMLAFGYALWVLLKDLKGVKREGWGLKAEKDKDQKNLERVEPSEKSTSDM